MYIHTCVCVCMCTYAPHGRHDNTSLAIACLVVWLMAEPLTQIMWWRPGRARDPLPSMGIHHVHIISKMLSRKTNLLVDTACMDS